MMGDRASDPPAAPDGAIAIAEAIGLLRAGSAPEHAWSAAFGVATSTDGAPQLGDDVDGAPALRAAGRLARQTGAPLADVLATIAIAERSRASAMRSREAALAGPRASAALLRWLPLVGWALAAAVDPGALRILVATPFGWALLAVAAALWIVGSRWLRRLLDAAERAGRDDRDAVLPLALAAATLASGLDVAATVRAVGASLGGPAAHHLDAVATRLAGGSSWAHAWENVAPALRPLGVALRVSWNGGGSPGPVLDAALGSAVDRFASRAEIAAAELAVRSSLPVALCLMPAFVVAGVVPLVVAVAMGAAPSGL